MGQSCSIQKHCLQALREWCPTSGTAKACTLMLMLVLVDPQVLTVHSPFRVENLTNQQLEFNVHLFRGPQTPGAPGKGAAAISVVPNNPLAPGQQTYLPVPAIWSDSLLLHACIHLMVLHACICPSHIVHHLLHSLAAWCACLLAECCHCNTAQLCPRCEWTHCCILVVTLGNIVQTQCPSIAQCHVRCS